MGQSETALIEQARAGDVDAFARLLAEHQHDAVRLACTIAGPDGEDAVQEAFIKAFQHLDGFRPGRRFRPWLLTIVANEARNRRRGADRRTAVTLRLAGRRGIDTPTPEEEAVQRDDRQRLVDAVSSLDDRDREIVALRYFLTMSEDEAAEVLGCPVGTVKSRTSRALARLRTACDSASYDGEEGT